MFVPPKAEDFYDDHVRAWQLQDLDYLPRFREWSAHLNEVYRREREGHNPAFSRGTTSG